MSRFIKWGIQGSYIKNIGGKKKKKSNSSLNTRNAFQVLNFFPRYSKGGSGLHPSTSKAMQVSGDNSTTLMKLEPDRIVLA